MCVCLGFEKVLVFVWLLLLFSSHDVVLCGSGARSAARCRRRAVRLRAASATPAGSPGPTAGTASNAATPRQLARSASALGPAFLQPAETGWWWALAPRAAFVPAGYGTRRRDESTRDPKCVHVKALCEPPGKQQQQGPSRCRKNPSSSPVFKLHNFHHITISGVLINLDRETDKQ